MQKNARWTWLPVLFLLVGWLVGCGGSSDPVKTLSKDLDRYPEYSLTVEDLRVEEGFFPDYFLRFKILTAAGQKVAGQDTVIFQERTTDWYEVEEGIYARYENYVGMVVASKSKDGRRTDVRQAHPAGYQYVGDSRYGFWGGGGFWQFYGQYAFMRSMMGGWGVNRNDWGNYQREQGRGRPYYGPVTNGRPTFGSKGTQTQKARPRFYQQHTARQQRFSSKAQGRMGRTSSSWGRGSSRGK